MRRRVGRPSLIGTAARTAVVVGTASAVSNKVSNKQEQKAQAQAQAQAQAAADQQAQIDAAAAQAVAAQQAQAAAAAAPASGGVGDDMVAQLERLADLKAKGILTDEEFAAQKAKVLAG